MLASVANACAPNTHGVHLPDDVSLDELRVLVDRAEIFGLVYKFSEAANQRDADLFTSLWSPESADWVIGPPIGVTFSGRDSLGTALETMLDRWDFFVQLSVGGLVQVEPGATTATGRIYINEQAQGTAGKGNYNLAYYDDEYVKLDGRWYFTRRTYHTIYQSMEPFTGEVIEKPN